MFLDYFLIVTRILDWLDSSVVNNGCFHQIEA